MVARQLAKEELIQRFVASELQASTKRSGSKKKGAEAIDAEQDGPEETPTVSLRGKSWRSCLYLKISSSNVENKILLELGIEEDDIYYEVPKKYREINITTIGMKPLEYTDTGLPQVSAAILKRLAGKNVFSEGKTLPIFPISCL